MSDRRGDMEWIDRYLSGLLAADERELFEQQIQTDNAFRQQVEIVAALRKGILQAGRKELLEEIKAWDKEAPSRVQTIPLWRQAAVIRIAALLIIGLSIFLLWPKEGAEPDLFAKYFEPYPNVIMPTVRGNENEDSTTIQKAYRTYDQGDYTEAILLFEAVNPQDEGVLMYLGSSYLATGQAEKAIPILKKLEAESGLFADEARWYLVLAYLQSGNKEQANRLLSGSWPERYSQKTKEISQQIDRK